MGIGGSSQIFHSRRGMSPLIATVLLMAFAVALGGMIMNWSIGASSNSGCDQIKIKVLQFCANPDHIILKMQSDVDSTALQGIKLNVASGAVENALSVRDSAVPPGAPLELKIPFAAAGGSKVDLVGVIGSKADPYTCNEKPIETVDPIQQC